MRKLGEVQRFYILVILLPLAACTALFLLRPVLDKPGRTLCIFRQATGLPCPACNTGHGVYKLLEGDLQGAVYHNPVSIIAIVVAFLAAIYLIVDVATQKPNFYLAFKKSEDYLHRHKSLLLLIFLFAAMDWAWQLAKHFHYI